LQSESNPLTIGPNQNLLNSLSHPVYKTFIWNKELLTIRRKYLLANL